MNVNHPLAEKQLTVLPTNWNEWLAMWEKENNPFALMSLLRHGPEMPNADDRQGQTEATILYLRLAKNFFNKESQFNETTEFDKKENVFTCPRYILAKTAFQTLCTYSFQKKDGHQDPWEAYLWNSQLLPELLNFLGTAGYAEVGASGDDFHSLFCYSWERYGKILRAFCMGLAEFLIVMPFDRNASETEKANMTMLWRQNQHAAIRILWYFDRLDLLIEHRKSVDKYLLCLFEKFILVRDIELPFSTRSSKTVLRKPSNVSEVLRIRPDSNFWNHAGSKIYKAASVYLSLAANTIQP